MWTNRVLVYDQQSYLEHCTYIGDRIFGITFSYGLAQRTNRTFCIRWRSQCPLHWFLAPSTADWTCPQLNVTRSAPLYTFHSGQRNSMNTHKLMADTSSVVRVHSNIRSEPQVLLQRFWQLFKPTTHLLDSARHVVRDTVGRQTYVGVHLRMGDGANGSAVHAAPWFRGDKRLTHVDAQNILVHLVNRYRLLWVVTDNAVLRNQIVSCQIPALCGRVVAWNLTHAQELAMRTPNTLQHANVTFVEAMILGIAQCIVGGVKTDVRGGTVAEMDSASGFTVLSALMTNASFCETGLDETVRRPAEAAVNRGRDTSTTDSV